MTRKNDYGIETEQKNSRMGKSRYSRGTSDAGMIHSNYFLKRKMSFCQIIRNLQNDNGL